MESTKMENAKVEIRKMNQGRRPTRMSDFKVGDRVDDGWGHEGVIVDVWDDGDCVVLWDGAVGTKPPEQLKLVKLEHLSLTDEVQDLINILVQTGNDNKRKLSRQVAGLLAESRGALSRSDKMQAAAMLLVSAGLASQHDAERDDG